MQSKLQRLSQQATIAKSIKEIRVLHRIDGGGYKKQQITDLQLDTEEYKGGMDYGY